MLSTYQLLKIGGALMSAVREHVKYSYNLDKLFKEHKKSEFYRSMRDLVEKNYMGLSLTNNFYYKCAENSLKNGVGTCGNLCYIIIILAEQLDLRLEEECYISILTTGGTGRDKHFFVYCIKCRAIQYKRRLCRSK